MCKKIFFILSLLFLLVAVSPTVNADLVAYYPFDGSAEDVSGNELHGTEVGGPTYEAGIDGDAISLDGTSQYVDCGNPEELNLTGTMTLMAWVNPTNFGSNNWHCIISKGDTSYCLQNNNANLQFYIYSGNWNVLGSTGVNGSDLNGTWHHIAGTYDGSAFVLYLDGVQVGTMAWSGTVATNDFTMAIGSQTESGGRYVGGLIDEVYIFDSALSPDEVVDAMNGGYRISASPGAAKRPKPGNNASDISIDTMLEWTAAYDDVTHNVYFGTDKTSVSNATIDNPMGVTVVEGLANDESSFDPDRLDYGTTYYWRVDEVNDTIVKGTLWNFTTEPLGYPIPPVDIINVTASSTDPTTGEPNSTVNELGLDANDMHSTDMDGIWATGMHNPGEGWIQYEFDKIYKLSDIVVWNYNAALPGNMIAAKNIMIETSQDGETWTDLAGTIELKPSPGTDGYLSDDVIAMNGVAAKYVKIIFYSSQMTGIPYYGLSEVRFNAEPTRASGYNPEDGDEDIAIDAVLSWEAGRDVDDHYLYLIATEDPDAIANGEVDPIILSDASYASDLMLGKTYYWQVNEVNESEVYVTWDGPLSSFITVNTIVVDDIEDYNDTDGSTVWDFYKSGYDTADNGGSFMGHDSAPYAEEEVVHGGNQSAPMYYDNVTEFDFSQVVAQTADLKAGTDWTIGSPKTLTIWICGDPCNVAGDSEIYCTIGGKTATYQGSTDTLVRNKWYQWDIDLASLDADLSEITDITIGIRTVGTTGGNGIMYLDDIQLTGSTPIVTGESIYFEAETMTLTGSMQVYTSTAGFSDTGYVSANSALATATEPNLTSLATKTFTVSGGKYIVTVRARDGFQFAGFRWLDSFWVRITGDNVTTDVTLQNPDGWVNWDGATWDLYNVWNWVQVWNLNDSNQRENVTWTLPAGTYTIEFTYKEAGDMLDIVEILQVE